MLTIPPVAAGIFNPLDLYNDNYNELPDLTWQNPTLHDTMAWLNEQIPFEIVSWGSVLNQGTPGFPGLRSSTHVGLKLKSNGAMQAVDVRNIMLTPMSVHVMLYELANPGSVVPQIKPYPGYKVRHPDTSDPIGAPWPDHPQAKVNPDRKFFHPATGDEYPVDAIFERSDGVYKKCRFIVSQGFFFSPAVFDYHWQKEYSR